MKVAIVFVAVCIAIASALPVTPIYHSTTEASPQIVAFQNDNIGVGPYNYAFETSNGIKQEEHAQVIIENDEPQQLISGSYSYYGPDQQQYVITYTADKNGFHPSGAHIPQ